MDNQTTAWRKIGRILVLLISLAIGGGIIALFLSRIEPPERIVTSEKSLQVRVIEAPLTPVTLEASGFGSAVPSRIWSAVSSVKGHVIFRRDDLESGTIIDAGTLLLEIDPSQYSLAIREAEAEIASVETEIAQLKQEAENTALLLELEQQRLDLSETSLQRTRSLVTSGAVPQSNLDTQLRATLAQREAVQGLINQQNLIPIQLTRLNAQKEQVMTKRAQARSELEDTKFYAPFDMRISEVKVEMHQFINPGQLLFSGDDISSSEVVLQVPMQSLRRVLSELGAGVNEELDFSQLNARVQLVDEAQVWPAQVIRIANGIDVATRTVRVVLNIDQPDQMADIEENPPLPKGMFVEGVLQIESSGQKIVLPRSAVHQNFVYLVDENKRLVRREIKIAFSQNEVVVIEQGVEAGDKVILDDIIPAISGMLLDIKMDETVQKTLVGQALGAAK